MIFINRIQELEPKAETDNSGGIVENPEVKDTICCKVSYKPIILEQNNYLLAGTDRIYICTRQPLKEDKYYKYNNKLYTVRYQAKKRQIYYSVLEEVE